MDHLEHELKKEFQLERMILFSDAVFAIAITLLVIEIKVPELHDTFTDRALLHELDHLLPRFIGFLISFFIIGMYWMVHHRMFGYVTNYDKKLLWLNLIFLLSIVLMPFSTGFFGEYSTPHTLHLKIPVTIYVLNICFTGFMTYLLWNYIGNPANKLAAILPDANIIRYAKARALIISGVFLLSIPLSFVNFYASRYVFFLAPIAIRILKKRYNKPVAPAPVEQAASL